MADTAAAAAAGEEGKHATFMRRAIELSERAGIVEKTGGCFGAIGKRVQQGRQRQGVHRVVAGAHLQSAAGACCLPLASSQWRHAPADAGTHPEC